MILQPTKSSAALLGRKICKSYRRDGGATVQALDGVSFEVGHGGLNAVVGPDGAGKTTLMRLAAGLIAADDGELKVLGIDVAADAQGVQDRIGYMPQKFGLYEDLTVQENMDLYADLHGVIRAQRLERYPRLMQMTALGPFRGRLAGKLSGGMKQKLGLACALIPAPALLLLDEPTVGVDPLSRRELWQIIRQLVDAQGLTVVLSTSYLDEAEHCGHVLVLHQGRVLAQGPPSEVSRLAAGRTYLAQPAAGEKPRVLQVRLLDDPQFIDAVPEGGRVRFVRARKVDGTKAQPVAARDSFAGATVTPVQERFEDGFMTLLREGGSERQAAGAVILDEPLQRNGDRAVVEVRDLIRRFGGFVAVDHVSFEVHRGEIFGLLGPNGAGKTTTFRMLCGLLPATAGDLRIAGIDLHRARASARQRIGYVAQKFSLYGQLTVIENLEFFASAYGLRGDKRRYRIEWALQEFELGRLADTAAGQLPGGYKQRLAMAAALLHQPEILFLDEPTSGVDPLARREFWRRITGLAEQSVTVIITTHFMEEAEYCDRIAIMDAGRILAQGTPARLRQEAGGDPSREPNMEDAFIAVVEQARRQESSHSRAVGVS